ncbi:uncharacterized protein LOC126204062 [Schistocerca nitens]|uniref:uncharacterized protein LOC126204062 n=1 Tax=Schistocerca nitens TaxID=7011 RepID=UPI002119A47F|nr:uncharacterized protein LOC126204062 [Schistocerca nitens]
MKDPETGAEIKGRDREPRRVVEEDLEEEEVAAFRPRRQTQDHIYTRRTITEKNKTDLYLTFLDIKTAFDTVAKQYVWKALEAKRVLMKLIDSVKSVYEQPVGVACIDGEVSGGFSLGKGIKERLSLSPLLIEIFLDEVTKTCKR